VPQAERISPQEPGEAIGGEKERGCPALGSSRQLPIRVSGGIAHPLSEFVHAWRIRTVEVISGDPGCNDGGSENQ